MSTAIEATKLFCRLGGTAILQGASLSLAEGRITALLGPSGSGKTTLLRALAGLEDIEAGEIRSGGQVLSRPGYRVPPEHRRIGVVFQDYALFPHLTVLENVAFGLKGQAEARQRATDLIAAVELEGRLGAYPHELSGGEQQRVALARALAPQPAALLMDEPFSNLDAGLRREMRRRTVDLLHRSGTAVLIVTHDAEEAMLLADEMALLDAGRIIQCAAPEDVYLHPVSARAAALTGDINLWRGRIGEGGAFQSPFLRLQTDMSEGTQAVMLVRPEALTLTPGSAARIVSRRLHGPYLLFEIEAGGQVWRVRAPLQTPGKPGETVGLTVAPGMAACLPEAD